MNRPSATPPPLPPADRAPGGNRDRPTSPPYVAFCGVCLGIVFLAQLQQGLFLGNLLAVMLGVLGLVSRLRIGPLVLAVSVAMVQLYFEGQPRLLRGTSTAPGWMLQFHEFLLCAGVVGYVAGHYRLQAIWLHLHPVDPRQRVGPARRAFPWLRRRQAALRERRPPGQVTPLEVIWLIVSVLLWTCLGFLLWLVLSQPWNVTGLTSAGTRIVMTAVTLGLGAFVVRMVFGSWRHRQRGPTAARMYLQDTLWRETRGEQRRLNRWLAWWRLRKKSEWGNPKFEGIQENPKWKIRNSKEPDIQSRI